MNGAATRSSSSALRPFKSGLLHAVPDELFIRFRFYKAHGFWPQLNPPRSWNEHLTAAMLRPVDPLRRRVADKLEAYTYVEEMIGRPLSPQIYQVVEDVSEIDWDALPQRFVMKPNHASGRVRVVRGDADRNALREIAASWLKLDFSRITRERVYGRLRRRILFEELIDDGAGATPDDYKLHVFQGRVRWIQVHTDRFGHHRTRMYWPDWTPAPFNLYYDDKDPQPPPKALGEMIDIASRLCAPFDFMRVDLYHLPDRIVFGELTNYTGAGRMNLRPLSFDFALGQLFSDPDLPYDKLIALAGDFAGIEKRLGARRAYRTFEGRTA